MTPKASTLREAKRDHQKISSGVTNARCNPASSRPPLHGVAAL